MSVCKACGEVHLVPESWDCHCGKHTGVPRLSDVRRDYGDEHHGVWHCSKGTKTIERPFP